MNLMAATLRGDLHEVDRLLDISPNSCYWKNYRGYTALIAAAQKGHDSIVSRLIAKDADVNHVADDGATALAIAAQYGHANVVDKLISEDADVNHVGLHGATALLLAAQNGHDSIVSRLIANDANVNHAADNGDTALYIAAQNGHDSIVRKLINEGANTENIEFFCPIDYPYCNDSNNSCYGIKEGENYSRPRGFLWESQDGCKYDYRMGLEEPSTSTSASNEDFNTPLMKAEFAGSGVDVGRMDGGSLKSKRRNTKRRNTKRRKTKRKNTKNRSTKNKNNKNRNLKGGGWAAMNTGSVHIV